MKIRQASERGTANFGWLDSRHSFSFGHYFDPAHMGFGPLRVINEDRVRPGAGFDTHSHQDMEIISYVIEGALEHRDSLGTGSIIVPGEVQRMTAGTGIQHSEYNHSRDEPVHFLQIWIHPDQRGLKPGYEQQAFAPSELHGQLRLVGSADGRDGSITIHQDVNLYAARLDGDDELAFPLETGRIAWVQVVRGTLTLNGEPLNSGDGAAFTNGEELLFRSAEQAEILLFDMAG